MSDFTVHYRRLLSKIIYKTTMAKLNYKLLFEPQKCSDIRSFTLPTI